MTASSELFRRSLAKVNEEEFGPNDVDKWLFLAFLPSCQSNVFNCHYRNERVFRYLTIINCNKRCYAEGHMARQGKTELSRTRTS